MEIRGPNFIQKHTPLPSSKKEAEKFLGVFHHLSQTETEKIVSIVIDEVKTSRGFGLYLEPQVIESEELLFLAIFDRYGGVENMVKGMEFEKARYIIQESSFGFLSETVKKYHDYFRKTQPGSVLNRYAAHLSSLCARMLQDAYHGQIVP